MKTKMNINELAESWVATDPEAIRRDVARLGSVEAAAEYSADLAFGQPRWNPLSTPEGIEALRGTIRERCHMN